MGSDSALAVRKKEFDPPRLHKYIFAHSSNGKTEDFESSNPGSSPGWASKNQQRRNELLRLLIGTAVGSNPTLSTNFMGR